MQMLAWAALLILQNAAFTWVSRARNSGSDWYHAIAAVFSNGIWFFAMFITFDFFERIAARGFGFYALIVALVYIAATVTGSVFMGKFLRAHVEKGARRVGFYTDKNNVLQKHDPVTENARPIGPVEKAAAYPKLFYREGP